MSKSIDPNQTLLEVFGYSEFRPQQEEIVETLIAGQDAFVLMPTGGGKSLCYQIPALHRDGVAIVVSPLISLMKDQVDALVANGVRAAFYNSSLKAEESRQVLARLHAGELDLLYVAPERLLSDGFLERIKEMPIALFAIDEAHCVSQWGHDFRPEYVQLGQLHALFPAVPMIGLTATADPQTRQDVLQRLGLQQAKCFITGFDRPNIRYTVVEKRKPFDQLLAFLDDHQRAAGIIYALSRKRVEEIADRLAAAGFKARAYHAGLGDKERKKVQEMFLRDDIEIVVATVAFGMGIDKPNVRFVVHYDLPKNIESYYQETGRSGRDGLPAEALLLFGYGDIAISRGLIEKGGNQDQKRIELHKLQAMVGFGEAQTCRRRVLLGYFGARLEEDCGNCDVCLNPPETYDATVDAQKALSCVFRVGQRFGVGHVVDVLRGAQTQRILELKHDKLSTYGIGADKVAEAWNSLIRQLIHRGYLVQDVASYSVLKLTAAARPLLRGEEQLVMAKPRLRVKTLQKKGKPKVGDFDYDSELFDALRLRRKRLADADGVPPYVIFGDATLAEMAAKMPTDEAALLAISGVGKHKLQRFGSEFIDEIIGYMCR
ncbi:MAG: DNA helicase RecQ [Desulfuromonadales bacterium]|nr:DNA helicase RecQ [Desulfuromonadales bacterium]